MKGVKWFIKGSFRRNILELITFCLSHDYLWFRSFMKLKMTLSSILDSTYNSSPYVTIFHMFNFYKIVYKLTSTHNIFNFIYLPKLFHLGFFRDIVNKVYRTAKSLKSSILQRATSDMFYKQI